MSKRSKSIPPRTFAEVVRQFPKPSIRRLADMLGEPYVKVQLWVHRDSIPAEYWRKVVRAGALAGLPDLTYERLAAIAEAKALEREAS